jgi:hypothetical protein
MFRHGGAIIRELFRAKEYKVSMLKHVLCRVHSNIKIFVSFRSPYAFYLLTAGVEVVHFHLITIRHTSQSVGLLRTRDRPVAETST